MYVTNYDLTVIQKKYQKSIGKKNCKIERIEKKNS